MPHKTGIGTSTGTKVLSVGAGVAVQHRLGSRLFRLGLALCLGLGLGVSGSRSGGGDAGSGGGLGGGRGGVRRGEDVPIVAFILAQSLVRPVHPGRLGRPRLRRRFTQRFTPSLALALDV